MREILFRGKRLDNGEWVEGAYLNDRDGAFYICPAASDITYGDNGNRRRIGCWYKVDPATVGQYTGLTDSDGDKIFEGDVVALGYECGKIEYSETEAMFQVVFYGWLTDFDHYYGAEFEVVGNIHDNPELIGGDES